MDPMAEHRPGSPAATRDAGLRRASAITRLLVVGAVALTGAIAGVVAHAKPGRSSTSSQQPAAAGKRGAGASASAAQPSRTTGGSSLPDGSSGSSGDGTPSLTPPSTPPAPTPVAPATTSGGS
jgi:hypothetical protein